MNESVSTEVPPAVVTETSLAPSSASAWTVMLAAIRSFGTYARMYRPMTLGMGPRQSRIAPIRNVNFVSGKRHENMRKAGLSRSVVSKRTSWTFSHV